MSNTNLIFHYQTVVHNIKEGIFLHEAFSTRTGQLYMLNPVPAEVNGDTEEEIDLVLKAMDADSVKFKPVNINSVITEMERWTDEVDAQHEFIEPTYEDEEDRYLDDDYLDSTGEVIDLVEYFKRK